MAPARSLHRPPNRHLSFRRTSRVNLCSKRRLRSGQDQNQSRFCEKWKRPHAALKSNITAENFAWREQTRDAAWPADEPNNSTRPVYRKASRLTIRAAKFLRPIATLVLESSVITVGDGPRLGRGSRSHLHTPRPLPLLNVADTRILTQCQRLSSQAGGPACWSKSKTRWRTISSFPG